MLFTIHILVKKIKREFIINTLTIKKKSLLHSQNLIQKEMIKDRKLKVLNH